MFDSIWRSALQKSSKLDFCKSLKSSPLNERYLQILPIDLRHYISILRISAHRLPVELRRYATPNPLPRNERLCHICQARREHTSIDVLVGDEHHFLFTFKVATEYFHNLNQNNLSLWKNTKMQVPYSTKPVAVIYLISLTILRRPTNRTLQIVKIQRS